jgi:hypothetical protein
LHCAMRMMVPIAADKTTFINGYSHHYCGS